MRDAGDSLRRAAIVSGAFVTVLVVGTIGFAVVGGESLANALHRTLITISTAGLVAAPEGGGAKAITAILVVSGVAIFIYAFTLLLELVVGGTVSGVLQERRMRRRMERLDDHYIVCGYGRMGRSVAGEVRSARADYVVIDRDPGVVAGARDEGEPIIEESGSEDDDLEQAGIGRARGLVVCVGSDAENLYVVLTARELRPA